MSEAELLAAILDLARLYAWRIAHFRPARTSHGWRTPMTGDVGWPDLLMCRGDRIVAAELKSDRGIVTQDQANWLSALRAGGVETYVWRPADWHFGHILTTLQAAHPARGDLSLPHMGADTSVTRSQVADQVALGFPDGWVQADDARRRQLLDAAAARRKR
jgi:hypothetical protein